MSSKSLIYFGDFEVTDQVFYKSSLCYALVNIKPVLPGHVLVIPFRREARRLTDLSEEETTDMFKTVNKVQRMLAKNYFSTNDAVGKVEDGGFNVAFQDGKWAGQTVFHVHCHIVPRTKGNDEGDGVYEKLENEAGNVGGGLWDKNRPTQHGQMPRIEDADRKPRSAEEMNKETALFRDQMALVDAEQ